MKRKPYKTPLTKVVELNNEHSLLILSNELGTETDIGENYCMPISDKEMWDDGGSPWGKQKHGVAP